MHAARTKNRRLEGMAENNKKHAARKSGVMDAQQSIPNGASALDSELPREIGNGSVNKRLSTVPR